MCEVTNPSVRPSRASFRDVCREAYAQVTIYRWSPEEERLAQDIAKIMAEVYLMPEKSMLSIGREMVPAELVKQVYRELEQDHVDMVIESFKRQREEIRSVKAYMRTMLYNAVFELEFSVLNDVRTDGIV